MLSILNADERLPRTATLAPKDIAEEANLKYERIKMAEANCREAIQGIGKILGLQGIEWVILGDHSGGSMQVRTLRRRYSSSRSP